jgi:tRNA(Arg) A34 adenosine deaminase TadA
MHPAAAAAAAASPPIEEVYSAAVEQVLRLQDGQDPPTMSFHAVVVTDRQKLADVLLLKPGLDKRMWSHVRRVKHESARTLVLCSPEDVDETREFEEVAVPSVAPLSTAQAREWSARLWPVSRGTPVPVLHPDFSDQEQAQLREWMRLAWRVAGDAKRRGDCEVGAVLVDPRSQRFVGAVGSETLTSGSSLRHAVMVAIARVGKEICAARLASSSASDAEEEEEEEEEGDGPAAKRGRRESLLGSCETYLCTGFDAFVTHEPCAMCAMALLHSRVRRVFWDVPDPKRGALGSVVRLHALPNINHRYRVFRGFYPGCRPESF